MENVWLVFISEITGDDTMNSVHSVHANEDGATEMVESLSKKVYGFNHVWWERWVIIK